MAFGVTGTPIPRPKKKAKTIAAASIPTSIPASIPYLPTEAASSAITEGAREMPPTPPTSSLLDVVKKFKQIKTKLQSPSSASEFPLLVNARQIFKDWMKKDFTAFFSLNVLYDAEKALTELYKAQSLSKAQYEFFLNFFENLRALRDQHQKAEWVSNRVKCYQEKRVKSSVTLQQLVEE